MDQNITENRSSRKKSRNLRKGRVAIFLVIISLLIAGVAYAFLGGGSSAISTTMPQTVETKGIINILVMGVDAREEDVGRSDTIFVVTIDTVGRKISMLSIPRDSRVKIDGHGWDKINHAYAFGGSKLSKSAVENLLGIPMDHTVIMSFQGFVRLIDVLGGVTIDVDKRMVYSDPNDDNGGLYINLQPGVQKLNGKTAIEYVRYRDEEGDIGRVNRQQKFLKALLQEFTKPQLIAKLPELIKEFAAAVRTDMPTQEMITLIPVINDAAKAGLHTEWVAGSPAWIQEVSYWLPDIKELRNKVAKIQGVAVDGEYAQVTERLVSEYAKSVPRENRDTESATFTPRSSNVEKQTISTSKKITDTTDKTQNKKLTPNKPKSEDSLEIEEDIPYFPEDKPVKTINKQERKGTQDSTVEVHKSIITDTNDKAI
jgi:LCP family protein required for cell wall assembly